MQKKTSPNAGQNNETKLPFRQEAMNSRDPKSSGETANLERYPKDRESPPVGRQRNTEGIASKYPLQVSRAGERRI